MYCMLISSNVSNLNVILTVMDESDSFWFFANNEDNKQEESATGLEAASNQYKTDNRRRGIALILNHMNYEDDKIPIRDGTNKDRDDLRDLFAKLSFEVIVNDDLTYAKTYEELNKVSKMDHADCDCLVVVVMSHGLPNKIFAYDKEYDVDLLWNQFTPDNCPSLTGKPKLFFIQACRGTKLDHGVNVKSRVASDAKLNNTYSLPIMADILVMYATAFGYYAWRSPETGAYFIQSLIQQMQKHAFNEDLLTILTYVNKQVAIEYTSKNDGTTYGNCKQMCCIVSMLTRLLYFKEK